VKLLNRTGLISALMMFVPVTVPAGSPEADIKNIYKSLINAQNWGIDDVMQHLHDMYQGSFRIDPIYEEEKVVFINNQVAETYAPVRITVAYGGQHPVPRPLSWYCSGLRHGRAGGWRRTCRSPFPLSPRANEIERGTCEFS
jgi:hypothetical protein